MSAQTAADNHAKMTHAFSTTVTATPITTKRALQSQRQSDGAPDRIFAAGNQRNFSGKVVNWSNRHLFENTNPAAKPKRRLVMSNCSAF